MEKLNAYKVSCRMDGKESSSTIINAHNTNEAFMTYLKSQIGGLNVAVFDELFENLDDTGVDAVVSLLVSLKGDIGSLFVISRSDELKYNSNFNHHLMVQKDDTTSKVSLD